MHKSITKLLLVTLLLLPALGYAQTSLISSERTTLLFPVGIYFELEAFVPVDSSIESLMLSITPEADGETQQISMPLDDETVFRREGASVGVSYLWEIERPSQLPQLFSRLNYEWAIELSDGTQEERQGAVLWQDQRFGWSTETTNNDIDVALRTTVDATNAENTLNALVPAYELLEQNTGAIPTQRFILLDTEATIGCDTNDEGENVVINAQLDFTPACSPALAVAAYQQADATVIRADENNRNRIVLSLLRSLIPVFYEESWRDAAVPAWFLEGLVRFYSPNLQTNAFYQVQSAQQNNELLSLADLSARPPEDAAMQALWQAQSAGLVLYMAERYSISDVYALAESVDEYDTFGEALEAVTGETLDDLYAAWRTWTRSEAALDTYSFNLYGPPTPTPTVFNSPTATNTRQLTLTPTPTATSTATLTPTITNTPTVTPTFTPLLQRQFFTSTPRPTATPVPANPLEIGIDRQTAQVAFATLIGLGVVLILIVVALYRSQN